MKKLLLFLILPFFALAQFDVCDHTFVMNDSFGDGWNGASVEILVGGTLVTTTSGPATSTQNLIFPAAEGETIELNWTSVGSYDLSLIHI